MEVWIKYFCDQSDVFRNICPRCLLFERVIFLVWEQKKSQAFVCMCKTAWVSWSEIFYTLVKYTNAWANNKINCKVGAT